VDSERIGLWQKQNHFLIGWVDNSSSHYYCKGEKGQETRDYKCTIDANWEKMKTLIHELFLILWLQLDFNLRI
jgi:hypothetical protein